MPKHNQSARIGDINNLVSTPTPPKSEQTDTQRIAALEQRVSTLEELLSDVMIQLDKPFNPPKARHTVNPKGKGPKPKSPKPQPAKPRSPSKKNAPTPKNKSQQKSPQPIQWGEEGLAKVEENTAAVLAYARQHPDGITKQQTIEATGLENKLVGRVLSYLCSQKQVIGSAMHLLSRGVVKTNSPFGVRRCVGPRFFRISPQSPVCCCRETETEDHATQSVDAFLDFLRENLDIDDTATIYADDLNAWGPLPNIPSRKSVYADAEGEQILVQYQLS